MRFQTSCLPVLIALCACGQSAPPRAPAPAPTATVAAPEVRPTDAWVGRWIGVEGTFLEIAPRGEGYTVTIQELEREGAYEGAIEGEAIVFTRRGVRERIVAGTGADTGLRYLAEEQDCLIVGEGEGFCR